MTLALSIYVCMCVYWIFKLSLINVLFLVLLLNIYFVIWVFHRLIPQTINWPEIHFLTTLLFRRSVGRILESFLSGWIILYFTDLNQKHVPPLMGLCLTTSSFNCQRFLYRPGNKMHRLSRGQQLKYFHVIFTRQI